MHGHRLFYQWVGQPLKSLKVCGHIECESIAREKASQLNICDWHACKPTISVYFFIYFIFLILFTSLDVITWVLIRIYLLG